MSTTRAHTRTSTTITTPTPRGPEGHRTFEMVIDQIMGMIEAHAAAVAAAEGASPDGAPAPPPPPPLTLESMAAELGSSRQYVHQVIRRFNLPWKSSRRGIGKMKLICPLCGGQKATTSDKCQACKTKREAILRKHHRECPICGSQKARHSNRCRACQAAKRPVPEGWSRHKLPKLEPIPPLPLR